jgi:hypothetical protein
MAKEPLEPDDIKMPNMDVGIPGLEDMMPVKHPAINPNRGTVSQFFATKRAELRAREAEANARVDEADTRSTDERLKKYTLIETFAARKQLAFKEYDHKYAMMVLEEIKMKEEIKTIVYGNEELKNNAKISNLDYKVREKTSREVLGEPTENRIE